MIICGIDPDTTNTAVCFGTKHRLLAVFSIQVPKMPGGKNKLEMVRAIGSRLPALLKAWKPEALVVEGQAYHSSRTKAAPSDILAVAQVAGAAAGCVQPGCQLLLPEPHEWKGSVPKPIHQMRTYRAFGLVAEQRSDFAYPLPTSALEGIFGTEHMGLSNWKHLGDAAGMVLWGAKQVALSGDSN